MTSLKVTKIIVSRGTSRAAFAGNTVSIIPPPKALQFTHPPGGGGAFPAPGGVTAPNKNLKTNCTIENARKIITSPITAFFKIFFASSMRFGSPLEVIQTKPPYIMISTATIDKNPNKTFIIANMIVRKSRAPRPMLDAYPNPFVTDSRICADAS